MSAGLTRPKMRGSSMTEQVRVADHAERMRALDVTSSFIVRAPAGSGKTRLLIQRYLALLAYANEPEEIIAITFTRKAAQEMRARVGQALASARSAADGVVPDDLTRSLAGKVLARDTERGWDLLSSAQRLRIQTIDSLNASLTRQMPMVSRFGAQPESVDDAASLYQEAARRLVSQVVKPPGVHAADAVVEDLALLLSHLDNSLNLAEQLIADMLRSRDHWLRNLPRMHEREALESSLSRVRGRAAREALRHFPHHAKAETLALARFAGQNMLKESATSALCDFADRANFPDAAARDIPAWLGLTELLFTKDGEWRKAGGINKRVGFPTSADKAEKATFGAMKERMAALIELLSADPHSASLQRALVDLRRLPPAGYRDREWEVLGAIVRLLPHATAHLWEVFGEHGQCDFTEIAQAASRALGEDDAPTDLALALDYRIQHLLVDEFQDTSFAQFELLEKLTRGWELGDGRTLFVVGDPMQSIYRFREAEVGLFLRAQQAGIGSVALEPITLSVNFRSTPEVIGWVNGVFSRLMPDGESSADGSVPYSASEAVSRTDAGEVSGATVHWILRREGDEVAASSETEAAKVVELIQQARVKRTDPTIAILVRNRSHLGALVPQLRAARIAVQAVDIDPLKDRPVVQDLFALTRAILHPADRIAWLAVMRAPWCGMSIDELAILVGTAIPAAGRLVPDERLPWELMNDAALINTLTEASPDGAARLGVLRDAMASALQARGRLGLREIVERTWLRLHGPVCVADEAALADADAYLDLLEGEAQAQTGGGQLPDLPRFEARLEKLFSTGQFGEAEVGGAAAKPVQIMTIHKAKGLEFDIVIVPGLHRAPRNDDKRLLVWSEQADPNTGMRELLLAPIREVGDEEGDEIYRYIASLERAKQLHEDVRLLYVAATRAERELHLLAAIGIRDKDGVAEVSTPKTGSLLAAVWPAAASLNLPDLDVIDLGSPAQPPVIESASPPGRAPRRIGVAPVDLGFAKSREAVMPHEVVATVALAEAHQIDFDWASDTVRHVGTVVHAMLQRIAEDELESWDAGRISNCTPYFDDELSRRGIGPEARVVAVAKIIQALKQTLLDSRGRWALGRHRDARAEWRLTGVVDGAVLNIAIDRTFVDEDGVRWIIDFKTGTHEGADIDAFLDNEVRRYRAQLQRYGKLIRALAPHEKEREIRLALYFPMLGGWREWSFDEEAVG